VRLKTGFPGAESGSTQKYPSRSNWNCAPAAAPARDGSTKQPVRISREAGFRNDFQSVPSPPPYGSAAVKRWS